MTKKKMKNVSVTMNMSVEDMRLWESIKKEYKSPSLWVKECLHRKENMKGSKSDLVAQLAQLKLIHEDISSKMETIKEQMNSMNSFLTYSSIN